MFLEDFSRACSILGHKMNEDSISKNFDKEVCRVTTGILVIG